MCQEFEHINKESMKLILHFVNIFETINNVLLNEFSSCIIKQVKSLEVKITYKLRFNFKCDEKNINN